MKNSIISTLLITWIGVVDQIHNGEALVEVMSNKGKVFETVLPTLIFPCSISEGDMFYFGYFGGVTEIRCGEPSI